MSNFTAGKWERYVYEHGGSRIFCGDELIADTYEPKGNADLFFAAQDMYEALIGLLVSLNGLHIASDHPIWLAIEKTKQALAKADGIK